MSKLKNNSRENNQGWTPWQPVGINDSKPRVSTDPVSNKLAMLSSKPYKQIIVCCFVCKLSVQPATTFQEIHLLNIDFNSHD